MISSMKPTVVSGFVGRGSIHGASREPGDMSPEVSRFWMVVRWWKGGVKKDWGFERARVEEGMVVGDGFGDVR